MACQKDKVPIGVLRQIQAKPAVRYRVLGVALVSSWDEGYFFLEGFSPQGLAHLKGLGSEIEILVRKEETSSAGLGVFEPTSVIDSRGELSRRLFVGAAARVSSSAPCRI